MTEQEKQELIECCKLMIDVSRNHEEVMIARIALASLTAPPVNLPKSERLDGNGYGYYFDMNDVFTALEEAGIKFEVEK